MFDEKTIVPIVLSCLILWFCLFLLIELYRDSSLYYDWKHHVKATKKQVKKDDCYYDYTTFKTFLRYYNNTKYEIEYYNIGNYENPNQIMMINKDVIRFDNNYMILYPISYYRYRKWMIRNKNNVRRKKGLWK